MAEKEQQPGGPGYPLAPAVGYVRSDEEAASEQAKELRRKKRMKCLIYIAAFAVFQTGIILLFVLTVMKIRTPRFRVRSATFDSFEITATNPSFNLRMNTELGVRNTNFGHFKYQDSNIQFFYRSALVGEANVNRARARARSTRKFRVLVSLTSSNTTSNSQLGSDLNTGVLPLTSTANLRGRIELFKVIKRNRSTQMNCTMEIVTATRALQNIRCK